MPTEPHPTPRSAVDDIPPGGFPGAPKAQKSQTTDEKVAVIAEFLEHCDTVGPKPVAKTYQGLASKMGWPSKSHLGYYPYR